MDRRIVDSNIKIYILKRILEKIGLKYLEGDCFRMNLKFAKSHSDLISKSSP
jgi:hypothetical protein